MRSICTFEVSGKGYSDLYETVLIDTPIGIVSVLKSVAFGLFYPYTGQYFSQFLEESGGSDRLDGISEVRNVLEEIQMELIRNSMLKLWLEDFYNFSQVWIRVNFTECCLMKSR